MKYNELVGYTVALIVYIIVIALFARVEHKIENVSAKDVDVKVVDTVVVKNIVNDVAVVKRYGTSKESEAIKKHKQEIVDYLWNKSKNIDLILTFEYESGLDEGRIAYNYLKNKQSEKYILDDKGNKIVDSTDFGICQLNDVYGGHSKFIESEDFKDWRKQADYCMRVYESARVKGIIEKRFFGYVHRLERRQLYGINQIAYDIYWNTVK